MHFGAALVGISRPGRFEAYADGHRPGIYDPTLADENLWIETEDAYRMTRWLGRHEGLLVGMSSGANVHAAQTVGKRLVAEGKAA